MKIDEVATKEEAALALKTEGAKDHPHTELSGPQLAFSADRLSSHQPPPKDQWNVSVLNVSHLSTNCHPNRAAQRSRRRLQRPLVAPRPTAAQRSDCTITQYDSQS